ncbi:MAG TPA: cyanophycin synthetase [Gaiellaceae bacterium]|nr:cyanophycin synthetase [Gaiellaceae bacterium]
MPSLEGRTLWLAGIGGAGMSGYAILARAWGAEVSGWDRRETPYLSGVRAAGIPVQISEAPPEPPEGAEAFVSSAFTSQVEGGSRAELLAELVGLAETIVVAGAHGKTTTTAMIAFVLDRLGRDPSFLVGGEIPQLGGNARAGSGWLVVEGDESDRSVFSLRPKIAVITNVDLDHHTTFASEAELDEAFRDWSRCLAPEHVVWGQELEPVELELTIPGEHNRRNAAAALAGLALAGVTEADAKPVLAEFAGAHRRLEPRGEAAGIRFYDDYGHHPAEIAATLAAARGLADGGRVLVLFQPHLYSRTLHLAPELASALAEADIACVTDIYPAREDPLPGVSGKLVVDRLAELRPGMRVGWAPRLADAVALLVGEVRSGDLVLTVGAGDVDSALPLLEELVAR